MRNIWIDCDPGIDDAIMLAMAGANRDKLKIHGISTVAGNVSSDVVTKAALGVSCFFGMEDVPVSRGARQPLQKVYVDCEDAHGENGLGGVDFPVGDKKETAEDGITAMAAAIHRIAPEKMTLVATGPLTNLALLLRNHPEVEGHIEEIVWMGGSTGKGNMTDYAEFNAFVDPHAAKIVLESDLPITMCDLTMTSQCRIYKEQIEKMAAEKDERVAAVGTMLHFFAETGYFDDMDYVEIYDAATMLYLLYPEVMSGDRARVMVETDNEKEGQTICLPDPEGHVYLPVNVDIQACNRVIRECLR